MIRKTLLASCALFSLSTHAAHAQTGPAPDAQEPAENGQSSDANSGDIVVTAQRQSERLQDVPIAVSAFTAEGLEKQQIVNTAALQQSIPSAAFTRTNFAGSSLTIRGIGNLCVGTCDAATAIHVNDMPLLSTLLFETEFYDLERIEVLRGPQGTLFGRNATAGVVNFITARPDLSGVHAAGEFEYGNYDSKRLKAMFNLPITDTLGIRVAGTYLNRDGYTRNLYDNSRTDNRDLYSVRGTLSWEPSSDTRIDLMGYYFREKDNRSRLQKQMCHTDPTGVLGCLPDQLAYGRANANARAGNIFGSSEFLRLSTGSAAAAAFGLSSIYGPDFFSTQANPADNRAVFQDYTPKFYAEEEQYQAKLFHDFGAVALNVTAGYTRSTTNLSDDYTQSVNMPLANNPGLVQLQALANLPQPVFNALFPNAGGVNPFKPLASVLIPNGASGDFCLSDTQGNYGGVYSGASVGCYPRSLDFDRSTSTSQQYSGEAHIDSKFDGPFNFLLGGIFLRQTAKDGDYYVTGAGIDYSAGIIPALAQASGALPNTGPITFATPFFRSNASRFRLNSYGIFGEGYLDLGSRAKLTVGLRYNHDEKYSRARATFLQDGTGHPIFLPYGATDLSQALNAAELDFDGITPGVQDYLETKAQFSRLTGRAVLDFNITPDNMVYLSYSRGYKSGGANPPLSPVFNAPSTFLPEKVDAFEIGTKNSFGGGQLKLNLTGFYYRYGDLQVPRFVARTAINDNINATIYGVEAEAILSPTRDFTVNANFSYLHSKITSAEELANPRDPAGGRTDTVIIKDVTNASNCAVAPTLAGNAAGANAFVAAVNAAALGLRAPVAVPTTGTTGAFSVCSVLSQIASGTEPSTSPLFALQQGLRASFGVPTGPLPFTVNSIGMPVSIQGNQLPQSPSFKASIGAQYTHRFANDWTLVPRVDLNYTGGSYASVFNSNIDRMKGYEVLNAQVQLSGPLDKWYVRAFVQNLTNTNAITGQYVTDQSSGLFTNVFTIEPRRYGLAAGFKF